MQTIFALQNILKQDTDKSNFYNIAFLHAMFPISD